MSSIMVINAKGGSGKTRRRGDKIKSNGKITRRKPI